MIYNSNVLGFKQAVESIMLRIRAGWTSMMIYTEFGAISITLDQRSNVLSIRNGKCYFVKSDKTGFLKRGEIVYDVTIHKFPSSCMDIQEMIVVMALADCMTHHCVGGSIMRGFRRETILMLTAAFYKDNETWKSVHGIERLSKKLCKASGDAFTRSSISFWTHKVSIAKETVDVIMAQIYGQWDDRYHRKPPYIDGDPLTTDFFMVFWFHTVDNIEADGIIKFFDELNAEHEVVRPIAAIRKYFEFNCKQEEKGGIYYGNGN